MYKNVICWTKHYQMGGAKGSLRGKAFSLPPDEVVSIHMHYMIFN